MKARLGIAPIAWSNDDLPELGGETTLETCLRESREAGFSGVETGGKFPKSAAELGPILSSHRLHLASGWYSGTVLDAPDDLAAEKDKAAAQLDLFRHARRGVPRLRRDGRHGPEQAQRAARHEAPALRGPDQGLWPPADAVRGALCRQRRAAGLPPSHGDRHRDRGGPRPPDEASRARRSGSSTTPVT